MNSTEKKQFRMSQVWKRFRVKMKKQYAGLDSVTMEPLSRTWNLHHMNLDSSSYTDISEQLYFRPLNERTHETVHYLYKFYKKDPEVLDRLKHLLDDMIAINGRK